MNEEDLPGEWHEVEPNYDFQRAAWQNDATGNVLVIEEKQEPWHGSDEGPDINVILLSYDHEEAPEPEAEIETGLSEPSQALRVAWDFIHEAPGTDDQ